MEIKGKFFPVGHGLTYAFKVGALNVLFDITQRCNLDDLEKFYGSKTIDILVISHFDADHSDGIHNLYDNGFNIGKVYIPYIGDEREIILYFVYLYKQINYLALFEEIQSHDTTIIEVSEIEVIEVLPFWKFNIHQSLNASCYVRKIIAELNAIGIVTKDDVRQKLRTHQQDIKEAYEKVMDNLNLTSLFMEHGPVDDKFVNETFYCGQEFISRTVEKGKNVNMHSLITGDCNLSINRCTICKYVDQLGYVLVPHHSGVQEWNDFICNSTETVVWIVTISKIRTRPYGLVVRDIYSNYEKLYICDKHTSFEYSFT